MLLFLVGYGIEMKPMLVRWGGSVSAGISLHSDVITSASRGAQVLVRWPEQILHWLEGCLNALSNYFILGQYLFFFFF